MASQADSEASPKSKRSSSAVFSPSSLSAVFSPSAPEKRQACSSASHGWHDSDTVAPTPCRGSLIPLAVSRDRVEYVAISESQSVLLPSALACPAITYLSPNQSGPLPESESSRFAPARHPLLVRLHPPQAVGDMPEPWEDLGTSDKGVSVTGEGKDLTVCRASEDSGVGERETDRAGSKRLCGVARGSGLFHGRGGGNHGSYSKIGGASSITKQPSAVGCRVHGVERGTWSREGCIESRGVHGVERMPSTWSLEGSTWSRERPSTWSRKGSKHCESVHQWRPLKNLRPIADRRVATRGASCRALRLACGASGARASERALTLCGV